MIRALSSRDLPRLKLIIDETGLFQSDMLDDMTVKYLAGNPSGEIWLTSDNRDPDGLLYCAPEPLTDGTWNVLLLAVNQREQRKGKGSLLINAAETILIERNARILIVETSGLPEFQSTRNFYSGRGFVEEARLRDFYRNGDDKVIYYKLLQKRT